MCCNVAIVVLHLSGKCNLSIIVPLQQLNVNAGMELDLNTCIQECALAHGTVPETEKLIYHFAMREKC
mgnify:FL=1